jgi:hypothetical protein
MGLKPQRPRTRKLDMIDVGFRVFGTLGGVSLGGFVVALVATNPLRSANWVVASVVAVAPMTVALGFALLSWKALRDDRAVERAQRMDIDFSGLPRRVRVVDAMVRDADVHS